MEIGKKEITLSPDLAQQQINLSLIDTNDADAGAITFDLTVAE